MTNGTNKFSGGIPPGIEEEYVVGNGKVERHTSSLEADEQNLDIWICVEGFDNVVSLVDGHVSLEGVALDTAHGDAILEQVQHGGELGEDDGLGSKVAINHLGELLHERLHFGAGLKLAEVDSVEDAALLSAKRGAGSGAAATRTRRAEEGGIAPLMAIIQQLHFVVLHLDDLVQVNGQVDLARRAKTVLAHLAVLHDALSAENVPTRGSASNLCLLFAQFAVETALQAHGRIFLAELVHLFVLVAHVAQSFILLRLASRNEVGVVNSLAKSHQYLENVGIVVENSPLLDKRIELRLGAAPDRVVKILLLLVESLASYTNDARRKLNVVLAGDLSAAQENLVENLRLELLHSALALLDKAVKLDWIHDLLVEDAKMLCLGVLATRALLAFKAIVKSLAVAALFLAHVVSVGVDTQKANERVQLSNAILKRRAGQAPLVE